jgi:hypothetical protein
MKKIILTIGIVLILNGCNSNLIPESSTTPISFDVGVASDTTAITTSMQTLKTTVAEVSSSDDLAYEPGLLDNYDNRIRILFTAMKTNDIKTLNLLGSTRSDSVYDFFNDIKFGNFTINSSKTADVEGMTFPPKTYNVTLSVLESNDSRFPVGDNTFEITALDAGYGPLFSPLHRIGDEPKITIHDMLIDKSISSNVYMCYDLSLEMTEFYGRDTVVTFALPNDNLDNFYGNLVRFLNHVPLYMTDIKLNEGNIDDYNRAAKMFFGIKTDFNENNIKPLWLGANMMDAVLVSETESSVVIDYYSDCLLLVKAFTMKYNFDTSEGFRFTSVEKLYDSDFAPSRYTT